MFIIDALILCGGYAKRLEPITTYIPKPLLPIGDKLMIDYANRAVKAAGADWIVCRIGDLHLIKNMLRPGDNVRHGPNMMVYVPPKESTDIQLLVQTLRNYPTIKAIQIDA